MTPEQQAAFIVAQAACVTAEVAAMQAENAEAALDIRRVTPPWSGADFRALIEKYGVHHNAVITMFTPHYAGPR
jgi:DMSO/TMAO reductase YedYZ molybdopterin-dependent catalytic subunit